MRIGIVGATGLTGRTLLDILEKAPESIEIAYLGASSASAGQKIPFKGNSMEIVDTDQHTLAQPVDIVFMACSTELSMEWMPKALEHCSWVIDFSSAFRMKQEVPLVVPEINGDVLENYQGLIANPNCSTIQLAKACQPIARQYGLQKVIVSTYQSVSGMGQKGIDRLHREEEGMLFAEELPLHHNVVPWIGPITRDDYCDEEQKIIEEMQKILRIPGLPVYPTTVRVPVPICHGESVYLETERSVNMDEVIALWKQTDGLRYTHEIACPVHMAHQNEVLIGHARSPEGNILQFWSVADNLRVGSAWNAYQILKILDKKVQK